MTAHGTCFARLGSEPLTERHVQAIWYDVALRPENIETRSGERVSVIHPGSWNLESGPDFKNAVLEIGEERRRIKGDVEVHISPSDWTSHRHAENAKYGNVIAHVTWLGGPEPQTLPAGAVSIWMGKIKSVETGFSLEQIDIGAYPFAKLPVSDRPCRKLLGGNPDLAHELLREAGFQRIWIKARRLKTILARRPGERLQIFYEEIMNALGYKKNSKGFRNVARHVPYDTLASEPENASAALLAAGGFEQWRLSGCRPGNSPRERLAKAGEIFSQSGIMYLAEVGSFSPMAVGAMMDTLTRGSLVGKGRAAAILVNVVLPFALAEGRVDSPPDSLPPEDVSSDVRLMASRLFGRDHNPCAMYASNGIYIQGMIHVFRNLCLQTHPCCEECALCKRTGEGEDAVCAPVCAKNGKEI